LDFIPPLGGRGQEKSKGLAKTDSEKNMEKRLIIAIDGYSSCGKSTFARLIAKELNYIFIDSGAMYRAVTLFCMRRKYISITWLNTAAIISELKDIHIDFVFNPDIMNMRPF
jgi:cytidylate kinase